MTDQEITPTQTLDPVEVPAALLEDGASALTEAVEVIDAALAKMMQRELVSAGEVADVLLDIRTLLTNSG